jgi:PAS domain S-box-containing protein
MSSFGNIPSGPKDKAAVARQPGKDPQQSLKSLLDQIEHAVLLVDRDWCVTYANSEAMRLSRLEPEGLAHQTIWQLHPALVGTPVEQVLRQAMETSVSNRIEHLYEPSDLWLDIRVSPTDEGIAIYYRDITGLKRTVESRDQVAARLEQILYVTSDAVAGLDWNWNFAYVNRKARELLAVKDDVIGKNIWEVFPAPYGPTFESHLRRAMDERIPSEFEEFYSEPLNLWLSIQSHPCEDGIVVFFRDVTERHAREQALMASEARYRALADLNPQAIWMGAADGKFTYANQRFLDYVGMTAERISVMGWLDAFYVDDRERVVELWQRSVLTGIDYDIEARITRASDGAIRWWRLRALPVRDEVGIIQYWLGVGIDIHDSKTAAEVLQQRQKQTEQQRAELETVYQTAPVGLAQFDPIEFRYLRLNERQAQILGLPSDQIVGRTYDETAPLLGLREMLQLAAAGHTVRHQIVEGELPTRPGERRVWDVSYSPVYGTDGSIQAITAAWLEITHLKKAESALLQSEKLAAVGRLASSISHEINNPLEAITNLLFLISQNADLPQELKIYVHMAQSELSRVSQIATQTLRFHRQAAKPTHVSPGELLDAVINLYHGRLANSGIRVEASYSTDTRILCFENDIRQVLNNLIANAIDAMRNGGGRLVVRAHDTVQYSTGRHGVRLTVADTGHGMSPTVQKRLFEPFYTTKGLHGTGLGLWISESIVQRHKGRLSVRSTQHPVHHGTVFSLFLPGPEVMSNPEEMVA